MPEGTTGDVFIRSRISTGEIAIFAAGIALVPFGLWVFWGIASAMEEGASDRSWVFSSEFFAVGFGISFAVFVTITAIAAIMGKVERARNYVQLRPDSFVFRKDAVTVSYSWNALVDARVEERLARGEQALKRAHYFTAGVIEPGLRQGAAATAKTLAIELEGFELPAAEIGRLMVERAAAAAAQEQK